MVLYITSANNLIAIIFHLCYHAFERKFMVMIPFNANDEVRSYISDIRSQLALFSDDINDAIALTEIEKYVFSMTGSHSRSYKENRELIQKIFFSLRKEMDILQPLIDDRSISEIMVNGKDNIFVERGGRIQRIPLSFDSTEDLEELIRRISARVHREINELNPILFKFKVDAIVRMT